MYCQQNILLVRHLWNKIIFAFQRFEYIKAIKFPMSGCANINITANAAPVYRLYTVVLVTEDSFCSVTTLLNNNMFCLVSQH